MVTGIARHGGWTDRWGGTTSRRYADSLTVPEVVRRSAAETSRWPEREIAGIEADGTKPADNVVHELDIRWALDRRADLPAERLAAALSGSCASGM